MSIYKEYQREPSRQRQCKHHAEKDGIRCRATAMHNEIMCFQHRSDDIPTVLQNDPFEIAHLDDRAAIQRALADTAARLACNHIDLKRAALLIQNLQVASANLTAHEKLAGALPFHHPKQDFAPDPDPVTPPSEDEVDDKDDQERAVVTDEEKAVIAEEHNAVVPQEKEAVILSEAPPCL
jgi:hypothetical protein